jgi:DNA-binding transcriptional LysR family regulator
VNLAGLDLNLVVALRALLEERNVTRAGQRIGLSQPAMSAALARLRRHFDDALSSDYAVAVFGAELSRTVHTEAPGIRLRFQHSPGGITENSGALLSAADGLLMPHGVISGFPTVELFRDRWVFLVAEDNPEVGDRLTLDDLRRLPWVTYQRTYDAPAVRQLSMLGIEPRVEVSADSFQVLPFLVAGTRRIALIQELLAQRLRGVAAVRIMEPPYEAVPLQEAMWWHPVHTHDAAHIWLRETAARVGAEMAGAGAAPDAQP